VLWAQNVHTLLFPAHVGPVHIPQKACSYRHAEIVCLHPMGSAGHIVHFGTSRQ
jgi:hypothetical protein